MQSTRLDWRLERDFVAENSAKSVHKFQETPRDRYIEDWEYEIVFNLFKESLSPYLAPIMELAYLCRMRSEEVRAFSEKHIRNHGVFIERVKGSENEITAYSDRLLSAISHARKLFPDAPTLTTRPLIHDKKGLPITAPAYKNAWPRLMKRALKEVLKEKFSFHDIKAKGVSDHSKKYGVHKDKKMQAVYNRTPNLVDSTK